MPVYFKGDKITPIIKDTSLFKKLVDRSITTVTTEDLAGVTSIGNQAFRSCGRLTSVTIPDSVTSIGAEAFYGCTNLTSITIPDSVTSIGQSAIVNCYYLKSIIVGNGVTNIYSGAFAANDSLTKIVIKATTPPTLSNANAFSSRSNPPVYVLTPDTYRAATNWSAVVDGQGNSRIFPLVDVAERPDPSSQLSDLSDIDTTTYTKACVIGNDEYIQYVYDGTSWNVVT